MRKIQTLFERDWEGDRSRVLDQIVPGCEWVLAGEGAAMRKYDGTCVMFDGTSWWARREVKDGKQPPPGFVSSGHDPVTLKNVGWEPIDQSPFAKFHAEALASSLDDPATEGTYELCGPKVQGNPEKYDGHSLVRHVGVERAIVKRTFDGMREGLENFGWEGFVFHHEDGRMAKIKAKDYGVRR